MFIHSLFLNIEECAFVLYFVRSLIQPSFSCDIIRAPKERACQLYGRVTIYKADFFTNRGDWAIPLYKAGYLYQRQRYKQGA